MVLVEGFGQQHAIQCPVAVGAEGGGVHAVEQGHCRVGVLVDYGLDVLEARAFGRGRAARKQLDGKDGDEEYGGE